MVITNGTIAAKVNSGTGLDGNGDPMIPMDSWGAPVPCRIVTNSKNNLGKQNGNTFTKASYEVLIEPQPFKASRVRLKRFGRDLGEFSVMFTEYLDAVGVIKIVV